MFSVNVNDADGDSALQNSVFFMRTLVTLSIVF